MRQATLKGELRYQKGKGAARRLRARHRVPAVIYGRDKDTTCISLDEREFEKALQTGLGGGTLIKLVLSKDGDEAGSDAFETVAILKEVQSDVVRGNAIHVDFQAVSMDEAITTKVPVVIMGEDARPSDGGVVQHMLWELELRALPMDIPQRVEVDISGLGLGDSLKVEGLNLPENIQVLTAEDEVIVHVAAPKAVVEEEAEDEEQAGEGAAEEHEASGGHEAE